MDDDLMNEQMETGRLEWERIEQELFTQREAERIANELEAQALLPLIEAERAKPTEDERLEVLESAMLEIIMGGLL